MFRVINAKPERYIRALAGADLKKGQLAIFDTGEAKPAAAALVAATAYGIVVDDADDTEIVYLHPLVGAELEADVYQGGVLKGFTDAMLGLAYDMVVTAGEMEIDPNDTNGGFFVLSGYNNTMRTCTGRIALADIYLA